MWSATEGSFSLGGKDGRVRSATTLAGGPTSSGIATFSRTNKESSSPTERGAASIAGRGSDFSDSDSEERSSPGGGETDEEDVRW